MHYAPRNLSPRPIEARASFARDMDRVTRGVCLVEAYGLDAGGYTDREGKGWHGGYKGGQVKNRDAMRALRAAVKTFTEQAAPNLWDHLEPEVRETVARAAGLPEGFGATPWDAMSVKERKALKRVWDRTVKESHADPGDPAHPHAREWVKTAARQNGLKGGQVMQTMYYGPDAVVVIDTSPQKRIKLLLQDALGREVESWREGWKITKAEAMWLGFQWTGQSFANYLGENPDGSIRWFTLRDMVKRAGQKSESRPRGNPAYLTETERGQLARPVSPGVSRSPIMRPTTPPVDPCQKTGDARRAGTCPDGGIND